MLPLISSFWETAFRLGETEAHRAYPAISFFNFTENLKKRISDSEKPRHIELIQLIQTEKKKKKRKKKFFFY